MTKYILVDLASGSLKELKGCLKWLKSNGISYKESPMTSISSNWPEFELSGPVDILEKCLNEMGFGEEYFEEFSTNKSQITSS